MLSWIEKLFHFKSKPEQFNAQFNGHQVTDWMKWDKDNPQTAIQRGQRPVLCEKITDE